MRSDTEPIDQDTTSGRARTFTEEARRRQLVEVTIDVIAANGFAGASLARIAEAAGVSKAAVLYHFNGKDELLEAVVTHIYTVAATFMWEQGVGAASSGSAPDLLRAYIDSNIRFVAGHPTLVRVLVELITSIRRADGTQIYVSRENDPVLEPLVELLDAGQESGEFRPFSSPVMALAIRRLIDAAGPELQAHPDLDVDAFIEAAVDVFTAATGARS